MNKLENFIEKSKNVHGDKYDYNLVEYINIRTKVKIICTEHGVFEQTPDKHINRKRGCQKCGGTSKLTTKEFIKKSKEIYGDKYDYSLTEYVNAHTKVKLIYNGETFEQIPGSHLKGYTTSKTSKQEKLKQNFIEKSKKLHGNKYDYSLVVYKNINIKIKIICNIHGEFDQFPSAHLNNEGCQICKNQKIFLNKCKKLYHNKYDYSLINYKDTNTKVKIICPVHGKFEKTPKKHYNEGCPKCSNDNRRYTTEEFIKKCNHIYKNKYDYSLVEYIGALDKVKIICPEHGIFEMSPNYHLNRGCPKCGNLTKGSNRLDTNTFIVKSKNIHGELYDYSLVDYKNNGNIEISILCRKHGIFVQKPHNHLDGHGCPICNDSKGEKNISNILTKYSIDYVREKRFNDCRDILPLPFDFYLKKQNMCIEYDGKQHYEEYELWGGKEGLKDRQKKDKIKTEYCENNGIKLLRIKYNENIENIMSDLIKTF